MKQGTETLDLNEAEANPCLGHLRAMHEDTIRPREVHRVEQRVMIDVKFKYLS